MFEVLWNRNPAAKTLRNIVPQGLNSLNFMSVLEIAVYPLNREDIQLGKICRKSEKKKSYPPGKVAFLELMFTAFSIALASSTYKRQHVLCFSQDHCTYCHYTFVSILFYSCMLQPHNSLQQGLAATLCKISWTVKTTYLL